MITTQDCEKGRKFCLPELKHYYHYYHVKAVTVRDRAGMFSGYYTDNIIEKLKILVICRMCTSHCRDGRFM
jgi:hypothetical protein